MLKTRPPSRLTTSLVSAYRWYRSGTGTGTRYRDLPGTSAEYTGWLNATLKKRARSRSTTISRGQRDETSLFAPLIPAEAAAATGRPAPAVPQGAQPAAPATS